MNHFTLKQARIDNGLSHEAVQASTGIPVQTLKRWEKNSGRADAYSFFVLCELYGIDPEYVHIGQEEALCDMSG